MRTQQRNQPSTGSDSVLRLSCPQSWKEMTQEQLQLTLRLMAEGCKGVDLRTRLLIHFTGLTIHKKSGFGWQCSVNGRPCLLKTWQVQSMIKQLEYVDSHEEMDVRLESVQGFKAVDIWLHKVPFKNYLIMEKYYQLYIGDPKPEYLVKLAGLLYNDGIRQLDATEELAVILWYGSVKHRFARIFHHFFRTTDGQAVKPVAWVEQMNAQIRVLTGGDVTKEETIHAIDCWRALTELDAKAAEVQEMKRKYPKNN